MKIHPSYNFASSVLTVFVILVTSTLTIAQTEAPVPLQIPVHIRAERGLDHIREDFIPLYDEWLARENMEYFERGRDDYVLVDFRRYYQETSDEMYADVSIWNFPLHSVSSILAGRGSLRIDLHPETLEHDLVLFGEAAAALSYYSIGKCSQANGLFDNLLKYDLTDQTFGNSDSVVIHYLKGNCAIIQQDYDTAIALFEQAMSLSTSDDTLIGINSNLAWAYLQIGQRESALEVMDNMLATSEFLKLGGGLSVYLDVLVAYAEIYEMASEHDIALAKVNEAIDLRPDLAFLYESRGRLYRNIYEWDNSLADFNTAIELNPYYADAYYERGLLYYSVLQTGQELREEALADFRHYLELAPDGEHAAEAREYVESIELELQALNED